MALKIVKHAAYCARVRTVTVNSLKNSDIVNNDDAALLTRICVAPKCVTVGLEGGMLVSFHLQDGSSIVTGLFPGLARTTEVILDALHLELTRLVTECRGTTGCLIEVIAKRPDEGIVISGSTISCVADEVFTPMQVARFETVLTRNKLRKGDFKVSRDLSNLDARVNKDARSIALICTQLLQAGWLLAPDAKLRLTLRRYDQRGSID
jgi:hypothetical protein